MANLILLALPLLATYLFAALWHRRFKQFANFPQLKPSLAWGHLKALHEYMQRGAPNLHHGMDAGPGIER